MRAKADRIDLLDDGTLRVDRLQAQPRAEAARALQLPVYGAVRRSSTAGTPRPDWTVSRAGYVAFKEKNAFVALGASTTLRRALEEGAGAARGRRRRIERGEFPVNPDEPFLCTRCGYAGVCRKDYVGDE